MEGETVVKDNEGNIIEIICSYDPLSKSGSGTAESQRKVKGTLHWVTQDHSLSAKVRLYDRLFNVPSPDNDKNVNFKTHFNPDSLKIVNALVEPGLNKAKSGEQYQFQRLGYFVVDPDSSNAGLIFNKIVGLRDTWVKQNG